LPAPENVIKSKYITSIFQLFLNNRDIRYFRNNFIYYLFFRIIRTFLAYDLIIKIYNFKIYGSIKKNKTSYYLLKKCEFGDYHELNTIKKFSHKNKILFIDCGCNYGFYSFYTASISKKNFVLSIEASKLTSIEFLKNLEINNFSNMSFRNNAISDIDNCNIIFNESENDWESSQTHDDFKVETISKVKSITIDSLTKPYDLTEYETIIKLDIEGNEMEAIHGGLELIKKKSPLIIIEFSKFIFNDKSKVKYLKNFLTNSNYSIYDTNKKKIYLDHIMNKFSKLKKKYKTIGNYYLIKNSSENLKTFLSDE